MRVGVIGVGIAGSSHLFDLVSNAHFTTSAVCASRLDRARHTASRYGIPLAFDDPAEMIDQARLDAIVIATPPAVTPDITRQVLVRGLPAVIDKPAAISAPALDQAVTEGPVRAVVSYNRRYQSHVHQLRTLIEQRVLGPLVAAECRWRAPFTRRYADEPTHRRQVGWGNGVVLDTGCHILDTLFFVGIWPLTVTRASLIPGHTGADVAARVSLYCPSHALPVRLSIDDRDGSEAWEIILWGKNGDLRLTRTNLTGVIAGRSVTISASDLRRPVDDLIALTIGARTYGATLPEAAAVLSIIDEIRVRAHSRRWQRPRAKALGRLNGAC